MGLFDFLKKKKDESKEVSVEKTNLPIKPISNALSTDVKLVLHEDINGLIWIADGKYKNYEPQPNANNFVNVGDIKISWSFSWDEEPSLIYNNQKISKPTDISLVPRPPYWPKYRELTPEQKWVYLRLLTNPYDNTIDVGFVFILYYGLERHLLSGDFDRAFDVILKLRDVHTNKSFQSYSANALILTAMLHSRGEKIVDFIKSLDKDFEFNFSDNLFLICYYSFNLPVTAKDIMRMAKTFEFSNTNYIKKYPEIFEQSISGLLLEKYKKNELLIKQFITDSELKKIKYDEVSIFANTSIIKETIKIPRLCDNFKLKKEMNVLLESSHELTKQKIASLRKNGDLKTPVSTVVKEESLIATLDKNDVIIKRHVFDKGKIPQGPFTDNDFSIDKNSIIKKHFDCIEVIKSNYARRNEGVDFLKKSVNACKKQIDISAEVAYWFYAENEYKRKHIEQEYGMTPIEHWKKIRTERGLPIEDGYDPCGMPEHTGYKQLCTICEKQGFFDEMITIAEQAKEEGWRGDWDKKIEKAKMKLSKKN